MCHIVAPVNRRVPVKSSLSLTIGHIQPLPEPYAHLNPIPYTVKRWKKIWRRIAIFTCFVPNAKVGNRNHPPMKFDLYPSETTRSHSLPNQPNLRVWYTCCLTAKNRTTPEPRCQARGCGARSTRCRGRHPWSSPQSASLTAGRDVPISHHDWIMAGWRG